MRAGLLSDPQVIRRINRQFVSTTLPSNVLGDLADAGHPLAREVGKHWRRPLMLMFFTAEGRLLTQLSSLVELNEVHPQTSRRPEAPQRLSRDSDANNVRAFLAHLDEHLPLRDGL